MTEVQTVDQPVNKPEGVPQEVFNEVASAVQREGKYLTFSLAKEEYGIGILKIKEIIGMQSITPVPQTPEVLGLPCLALAF